jgi:hypothetical protein
LDDTTQQQNPRTGLSGLDAVAHPADDGCSAGDHQRLPEGRRHSGARAGPAKRIETKTGNFRRRGVRRARPVKTSSKPAISGAVVSTDSGAIPASGSRAPSASACEPYRELIADALARGGTAMAIWQDVVDGHGFHLIARM